MRAALSWMSLFFVVPNLSADYTIRLETPSGTKSPVVVVGGIDAVNLEKLAASNWQSEQWNKLLSVKPWRGAAEERHGPAMLGSYRISGDRLVFEPRFPLQAGLSYQAVFDPAVMPAAFPGALVKKTLTTPDPARAPATVVANVFPTSEHLPENLLKFYIHFSAPMSQGRVYQHIQLLDPKSKPIAWPFLELDEELWNPDGTRFTLFFDPGRIKQGLKPREDLGPALEKGKKYTLVIDARWTDANNQPLKAAYRKSFFAGDPIARCAPMAKWAIQPGRPGTLQPLEVTFPAPMDSALLQRMLWLTDPGGKKVAGTIRLDREETVWRFSPSQPWQAGEYQLAADNRIEDLAGNSLGKPFEVDVFGPVERQIKQQVLKRSFSVK